MINNDTILVARIKKSYIETIVATGERQIEVEVDIYADGDVIETKKFGYPIGTPSDQIKTDIKNTLVNMKVESEMALMNEEIDREDKIAQETISELSDAEINE